MLCQQGSRRTWGVSGCFFRCRLRIPAVSF